MALASLASRLLDEMSHELLRPVRFPSQLPSTGSLKTLPFDLVDKSDTYIVQLELPGMTKDDVSIEVDDKNVLHVNAERSNTLEEDNKLYSSRFYGQLSSSILLPDNVNVNNLEAKMENGILIVKVPKEHRSKARKFQVK